MSSNATTWWQDTVLIERRAPAPVIWPGRAGLRHEVVLDAIIFRRRVEV